MEPSDTRNMGTSSLPAYLAVALVSGAILAYELFVMRVFANGGWSHFGSTVICIAMFGFGVFSAVLCILKEFFRKRLLFWIDCSLVLLGPAMVFANTLAQAIPFNPIFLVSDPRQKYYLAFYFLLYFVPFLLGAMFLGLFFLMGQKEFAKAYFANMTGSGLGGLALFFGMYVLLPERTLWIPLCLWAAGALLWLKALGRGRFIPLIALSAAASLAAATWLPQIHVSQYKGVSYARAFPDSRRICSRTSPFGFLEIYASSYFHFAPGLSDAATLYLEEMPDKAYLGMYIDGDGPIGIMKDLQGPQAEYIRYLPMAIPYLLTPSPNVLVMQFGGGISTNVALKMGARQVTVAEGNPLVVSAVRDESSVAEFTGHILQNPDVTLVPMDGRIFVQKAKDRFDIIDLSLADSIGLSMPGGSSIHEKYTYTKETLLACIEALKTGGILSVTVWNKEDPPKSVLKLMSTVVAAAREKSSTDVRQELVMAHTYLSTFTILYKKGGFQEGEIQRLTAHCKRMCFGMIYAPGQVQAGLNRDAVLRAYRTMFSSAEEDQPADDDTDVSSETLLRLAADQFIRGEPGPMEEGYVFDCRPLTNDRPYFAGYVKPSDISLFADKLEAISDEWGYLLLWATLLLSMFFALFLMALPVVFGWRAFFSRERGKRSIVTYFLCLGVGFIFIEIAIISKFILCLGNSTVSFTAMVTGMLLFSGLGSYLSSRFIADGRRTIIVVCSSIVILLVFYSFFLDGLLNLIGFWPYGAKALFCLLLLFPLAFLLGFPFTLGMATLSNLKKEQFFVWAWGINGSFSVIGSVLVPILSVNFGLSSVLMLSALAYLVAAPCFIHFQSRSTLGRGTDETQSTDGP